MNKKIFLISILLAATVFVSNSIIVLASPGGGSVITVESGAPEDSLYINAGGNIGIGIQKSPQSTLDILGNVRWSGSLEGGEVPWARLTSLPSYSCSVSGQYATGINLSTGAITCSTPSGGGTGTVTSVGANNGLLTSPVSPNPFTTAGTIGLNLTNISSCTSLSTSKIIWDSTNNRLNCAIDQTGGASNAWLLGGNTLSSAQSLGTLSAHNLSIIANSTEKILITTGGEIQIGAQDSTNEGAQIRFRGAGTNRYFYIDNYAGSYRVITQDTSGESVKFVIGNDGHVGIGTTAPTTLFSVGASSQFQVTSVGNLSRINNVPYSFPAAQGGANTYLRNDGSGNLNWQTAPGGPTRSVLVTRVNGISTPPACPSGWTDGGTGSANYGSGTTGERYCYRTDVICRIITTHVAGISTPPACPSGWTDGGTGSAGYGTGQTNERYCSVCQ